MAPHFWINPFRASVIDIFRSGPLWQPLVTFLDQVLQVPSERLKYHIYSHSLSAKWLTLTHLLHQSVYSMCWEWIGGEISKKLDCLVSMYAKCVQEFRFKFSLSSLQLVVVIWLCKAMHSKWEIFWPGLVSCCWCNMFYNKSNFCCNTGMGYSILIAGNGICFFVGFPFSKYICILFWGGQCAWLLSGASLTVLAFPPKGVGMGGSASCLEDLNNSNICSFKSALLFLFIVFIIYPC